MPARATALAAAVVLAVVIALVAWTGGEAEPSARAFTVTPPSHGGLVTRERVQIAGDVQAVYLGGVQLDDGEPVCVAVAAGGTGYQATYASREGMIIVRLDLRQECAPTDRVPLVGGYAPAGGYVGDWIPAAVLFSD